MENCLFGLLSDLYRESQNRGPLRITVFLCLDMFLKKSDIFS